MCINISKTEIQYLGHGNKNLQIYIYGQQLLQPENFFYRVTLCVSVIYLLSAFVRLSFRLSVTLVYCMKTASDILKLLSRPDSPIILVS